METLCPSVQSSAEAVRDQLTVGGILRAFLPLLLHLLKLSGHQLRVLWQLAAYGSLLPVVHRHWAPIFSIVHTVSTDIGRRAPAAIAIVRAAWPPKAGNG
ncbi:MAG TPA: hypothetical protein VGD41_20705 [Pyrinomonadaceae bacterium]